jgi:hypothetical protein
MFENTVDFRMLVSSRIILVEEHAVQLTILIAQSGFQWNNVLFVEGSSRDWMLSSTDVSWCVPPLAVIPPIVFHQVLDGIFMEDMSNLSIGIVAAERDGFIERDSLHGHEILPISLGMEDGLLPEFFRVEFHLFGGFGFGAHDGVLDPGFGVLVRYVCDAGVDTSL